MMNPILIIIPANIAWSYINEHLEKKCMLNIAKQLAGNKPIINIGSKFTEFGDVNVDVNGSLEKKYAYVKNFEYGNIYNLLKFGDKEFGCAFISHVLEHLEDPDRALEEVKRIADHVVVLLPSPLALPNLLHPDHKWIWIGEQRHRNNPLLNLLLLSGLSYLGYKFFKYLG